MPRKEPYKSKKEMFVRLHQRECIVRLFDGTRYLLPMKLKMVDLKQWDYSNPKYRGPLRKIPFDPEDLESLSLQAISLMPLSVRVQPAVTLP